MSGDVLTVERLSRRFTPGGGAFARPTGEAFWAVREASLTLGRGETLGVVGESGSGKTTLARCILQLIRPTEGSVIFEGQELTGLSGSRLRAARARLSVVFQDPYSALNPRWSVARIVRDPLDVHGRGGRAERARTVARLLDAVGLPGVYAERLPHELSGGERQRVAIARALALEPSLVVCDEPTSSLDVSVQAQILNLLMRIQEDLAVSFLFISHNLAVVRRISHRVAIMKGGRIVENGPVDQVFESPREEYTRTLLAAVPRAHP
jgi:peptide/nickel transport system ATP-binding protein